MNFQMVKKSANAKTGPIPTTNSPRATCPPACPLAGPGGCYAEAGFHTRLNWDKLDSGERGMSWEAFTGAIKKLKAGQLWRHNVSGDLPGANDVLDAEKCDDLVAANSGKRGFTYTHYPMDSANVDVVARMNASGFTVNLSGNSPTEARQLQAKHGLPTVTLYPTRYTDSDWRRDGDIVRCPAEYRDDVSCATCQLCQRSDRKDIVGFTVHGPRAKSADLIASA